MDWVRVLNLLVGDCVTDFEQSAFAASSDSGEKKVIFFGHTLFFVAQPLLRVISTTFRLTYPPIYISRARLLGITANSSSDS